jgi:hypothetical protein
MLAESARVLLRRWPQAIIAVVLSLAVGVGIFSVVKPDQNSSAEMLLVPPSTQPGASGRVNPFFSLGASTQVMTTVVQSLTSDSRVADKLTAGGYTAKYEVSPDLAQNAGPTLLVTTTDKSALTAQRTLGAVVKEIDAQLAAIQRRQQVSTPLLITAIVLTRTPHATPDRKPQWQLTIVSALVTLVLLLLLILFLGRRQRGREAESDAASLLEPRKRSSAGSGRPRTGRLTDRIRAAIPARVPHVADPDDEFDALAERLEPRLTAAD